jgi:hypothetical protein
VAARDAAEDPEGLQTLVEKDADAKPAKVFIVALSRDTLLGCDANPDLKR